VPLFFIQVPQPARSQSLEKPNAKTSVWQDFRAGLRYAWGWPGLVLIGMMATVINLLLTPAFALLPILVTKHFSGQALQLATMESTWGIGIVLGGITLGAWGGFRRRVYTSLAGLVVMGIGIIFIGLAPASAFTLAVGAIFVAGFAHPICNGPLFAAVQAAVEPEMQGRVFTLIGSMASLMSPIGLLIAGPLADTIGPNSWFLVGGVVTTLMGLGGFFVPAILHFEDGRNAEKQTDSKNEMLAVNPAEGD
jgi:DHA3 family macrolide efflux protein-like MFS transporter